METRRLGAPVLSIITAFLNEEKNLPALRQRLTSVLGRMGVQYEILLVDDHSTDRSPELAKEWSAEDPNVKTIRLSRNFGSHAAFSAGLARCSGDCAVLLAADLQDPPELIPELYSGWQAGNDVVWAVRAQRLGETWSTKLFSRIYCRLMRRLGLVNMPANGADFLLVSRAVIRAYNAIPEKNTSFLAMILWMGFRQTSVEYTKASRMAGASKWSLGAKIKLLIDSVVSFSYFPIRAMSLLGLIMALLGFGYAVVVIVGRLSGWIVAGTGFAALMTVLLVGQGAILLMLGILGEYLWRAFDEARGRPRYILESEASTEHNPQFASSLEDGLASESRCSSNHSEARNLASPSGSAWSHTQTEVECHD